MSTEVAPETVALAQKLLKQQEAKLEKVRTEIKNRHSHALTETLRRQNDGSKFEVQICCVECQNKDRWVYTSDLHQVKVCESCHGKIKKARKNLNKALEQKARALIRDGKIALPEAIAAPVVPVVAPKGWDMIEGGTEQPETPVVEVGTEQKKRKGGRPKGSKNKPKAE